jgi:pimeloyl-ACP methyl ester carboxylesterase
MPIAAVNGIEICYEVFEVPGGSPNDPTVLLVNGLGSQMIRWPKELTQDIVDAGFRLVTFDNRDVGLSSKLVDAPQYAVEDMADDAAALLAHLGIDKAHVVGMSMGGMIGQALAIRHPGRVLSLASIMSHMSATDTVAPTADAIAIFAKPPAATRDEAIESGVADRRLISGDGFPFDEGEAREMAARAYDRCHDPDGRNRQAAAIQRAGSRASALADLTIPVTVIHGSADPLVPVENGRRTAQNIPGAELVVIDGMGHDLPRGAIAQIVQAIVANARRAAVRS